MYHRNFHHITGNMDDMELESGESRLDSYAATVRTCWSVEAYSGEPVASVVTKNKQGSDIEHKRNGEGDRVFRGRCRRRTTVRIPKHFYGGTKHRSG